MQCILKKIFFTVIIIDKYATSKYENYGCLRSRCQNFPPGGNIVGFSHVINAVYIFLLKLTTNNSLFTRKLPAVKPESQKSPRSGR
jgi:hypothetical protein